MNPYERQEILRLLKRINNMLKPGDRVRIDIEKFRQDKNYNAYTDRYKRFMEQNKDNIYTVEFEEGIKTPHPTLVQFAEDMSDPKWLFNVNHLVKVEDDDV